MAKPQYLSEIVRGRLDPVGFSHGIPFFGVTGSSTPQVAGSWWLDGRDHNGEYGAINLLKSRPAPDLTGIFDPSTLSGFFSHWDSSDASTITAAGGYVSAWSNKAGTITATQGTSGSQPRTGYLYNGLNVMNCWGRFVATGSTAALRNVSAATIYWIGSGLTSSGLRLPFRISNNSASFTRFEFALDGSLKAGIRSRRLDADSLYTRFAPISPVDHNMHIFAARLDYTNSIAEFYMDGRLCFTETAFHSGGNTSDTDSAQIALGGVSGFTTFGFMGEGIICHAWNSDTELANMFDYAKTKWNIPMIGKFGGDTYNGTHERGLEYPWPEAGQSTYLVSMTYVPHLIAESQGPVILADLLLGVSAVFCNTNSTQTLNTVPLTRHTSGEGVCVLATFGGAVTWNQVAGRSITITYVNQNGDTSSSTTDFTGVAANLGDRQAGFLLNLAPGDTGVRSITSAAFGGTTIDGSLKLYLVKPLAILIRERGMWARVDNAPLSDPLPIHICDHSSDPDDLPYLGLLYLGTANYSNQVHQGQLTFGVY